MSKVTRFAIAVWVIVAAGHLALAIAQAVLSGPWWGSLITALINLYVAYLLWSVGDRDRQLQRWRDAAHADIKSGALYVSPDKRDRILKGLTR